MELRPISLRAAMKVVDELHRHLRRPQGAKFAIAALHEGRIVGVALVGFPPARLTMKREELTAEVTRVATDGTRNACSFLYARAKRAAQALGYTRVITKTLPEESGASLRAVGAVDEGLTKGGTWSRKKRKRKDDHPIGPKRKWAL